MLMIFGTLLELAIVYITNVNLLKSNDKFKSYKRF